jgi:hypothetical protein
MLRNLRKALAPFVIQSPLQLYFVDGLRGDDDLLPDGDIEEPGAPAMGPTVGGHTEQVNRLAILTPWVVLAGVVATNVIAVVLLKRRVI